MRESPQASTGTRERPTLIPMRRLIWISSLLFVVPPAAGAQWKNLNSNTTADLRGIHSIGNGVAWASGTNGTVLRTEDSGYVWQTCAVPPGADKLDFRGVQGFDANTAIVMSSGKGDLSRLYKTTDGCHSWKLIFTNPDPEGFWDAIVLNRFDKDGELLGDPVGGQFALWKTSDQGSTWTRSKRSGLAAVKGEGIFAASNSSLFLDERFATGFVTGGPVGARILVDQEVNEKDPFVPRLLPLASGSASTGGFSIEVRDWSCWVVVGGDYGKPDDPDGTAAFTNDGGKTWHAARKPPHGYRSSVAYDAGSKTWITVGPNGTDISSDDGKNWRAVRPDAARHEAPDADRNWNAISLPFVVGPKGRIGKLNAEALKK